MAIGNAVQRGSYVCIYDERGQEIASVSAGGSGPKDGLKGYTSSTVNVQQGSFIITYNERGAEISSTPA
jgi:hypothetical protein